MAKGKKKDKLQDENENLDDFSIKINEFGEIITNTSVEELNKFLDKNLRDKKLINNDIEEE